MSKTKSSNKPNKKGFTLIELLAVIVVLAIVLLIAVPTILYIQNKTRKQAFFTNVSNIVNTIKPNQLISEKDVCIYNYEKDENNKTKDIKTMYVLAHKDKDKAKAIYSVYALMDDDKTVIDIYDFSGLTNNNFDKWKVAYNEKGSYTYYAGSLINDSGNIYELLSYKVCNIG